VNSLAAYTHTHEIASALSTDPPNYAQARFGPARQKHAAELDQEEQAGAEIRRKQSRLGSEQRAFPAGLQTESPGEEERRTVQ